MDKGLYDFLIEVQNKLKNDNTFCTKVLGVLKKMHADRDIYTPNYWIKLGKEVGVDYKVGRLIKREGFHPDLQFTDSEFLVAFMEHKDVKLENRLFAWLADLGLANFKKEVKQLFTEEGKVNDLGYNTLTFEEKDDDSDYYDDVSEFYVMLVRSKGIYLNFTNRLVSFKDIYLGMLRGCLTRHSIANSMQQEDGSFVLNKDGLSKWLFSLD